MIRPLRLAIAVGTAVAALAIGIPAHAATNAVIAETGGATVTLNLFGSPLSVTVALDTTTGNISSVDLSNTTDFTATTVAPSRVRFEKNADGSTAVNVSARRDQLSMGVRTTKLDDLVGPGTWAADVFGTGAKSTVPYTVSKNADGSPSITLGTLAPAAGVTATALATTSNDEHEDSSMSAAAQVEFTNDGFRKVLTIAVKVESPETDAEDGLEPGSARLSFTLRGRDVQTKKLTDLVGNHSWKGQTCDGKPASIDYAVAADGTISVTTSTPTGTTKANEHGTTVTFPSGDKVTLSLKTHDDGTASLAVKVSGRHCTETRPSIPDPKVNTPVSTDPPTAGDGEHGGKEGGHEGGGRHGKGSTPTTGTTVATKG